MAHHPTFLVLDDDPDNRFLVQHALRKAFPDAVVLEASFTDEAVTRAAGVDLDGIITDHHLGRVDGSSLVQRLREVGVQCPVVMITSSSDPAVFRRAYEAGAARVFAGSDVDYVGYFRNLLGRSG